MDAYCTLAGGVVNQIPAQDDGQCQDYCLRDTRCARFEFSRVERLCKLLDSGSRECSVLLGAGQPQIDECLGSTTTATTPTSTTTGLLTILVGF